MAKLALLTMIRNESKRLKEWIEFHSKFYNFEKFVFYLDNTEDNSKELLDELKVHYNIEYFFTQRVGGYVSVSQDTHGSEMFPRQLNSFTEGFKYLNNDYDWIAIMDVDEFIVPNDILNFNLTDTLSKTEGNILYLPMYCFVPPFNSDKSIIDQNFFRWTSEERETNGHIDSGKSIIRGKMDINLNFKCDVHAGPDLSIYRDNFIISTDFKLHHFQSHINHINKKYELFDDSIRRMINNR
jgi:hypothetical protein